jgi:ABC-type Zn uptake system ZnuABC Zn-binding protein ZnuA
MAADLNKLAEEFRSSGSDFSNRNIVTMHEVFDYLARDNGLEIVATIHSAPGQEPSPAEMRQVIEAIKDRKAAAVFTEPQYSAEVAKTIAKDAGVPVFELDPVASGPADAEPAYYLEKMRENLETLKKALKAP